MRKQQSKTPSLLAAMQPWVHVRFQVFFAVGPRRLHFFCAPREGVYSCVVAQAVLRFCLRNCKISIDGILAIKAAQVQLRKSGFELLTYSDIDLSPRSHVDHVLHFLQKASLVPKDSL